MKQFLIITLLFLGLCCNDKPVQPYIPVTIPCTLSKNIDTVKLYIQDTWERLEEKPTVTDLAQMQIQDPVRFVIKNILQQP